jgi:sulfofructose kinase
LMVDGHDTAAATLAARWAREAGMPVVLDIDRAYPQIQALLETSDYVISTGEFPSRLTGEKDVLKALREMQRRFKCCLTGTTLGKSGVVAWDGKRFYYVPGFLVKAIDTTGAGDIFHGAFLYGVVKGWDVERNLEFSCAAAALACTAVGARDGIAPVAEIEHLMKTGARSERVYSDEELERAGKK